MPGSGTFPGEGNGYSLLTYILTWRIPWTEEPRRLQSLWSKRVGHDWATHTHVHTHTHTTGVGLSGLTEVLSSRTRSPVWTHLLVWMGEVQIESQSHVRRARFPQPHLPGHGALFPIWNVKIHIYIYIYIYINTGKAGFKKFKKDDFQCNDKRHRRAEG